MADKYLLEDGSGGYQLEDGSGNLLLDNTIAIALVQQATNSATSGTTLALTIAATSAGNTLILAYESGGQELTGVSGGGTWVVGKLTIEGNYNSGIWYCPNIAAGVTTVTLTFNGAVTHAEAIIAEFSGILTVNPADVRANNWSGGGGSTSASTGSITPTKSNVLVVGMTAFNASATVSAQPSGFTALTEASHAGGGRVEMAYQVQTTAAAADPTWTLSTSELWDAAVIGFRASSTPPDGVVQTATGGVTSGTSCTVTLPTAPTAGNVLILAYGATVSGIASIVQTGVTWSWIPDAGFYEDIGIWIGYVGTGAGTVITLTGQGSGLIEAIVEERSDIASFDAVDQVGASHASSTTATTPSITPSIDGCIVWGAIFAAFNTISSGPSGGYTGDVNSPLLQNTSSLGAAWLKQGSAGATTTSWTIPSGGWDGIAVSFFPKEASYAATVLADKPKGFWRLGESSGQFADASGNGHPTTSIVSTPTYGVAGALATDPDTAVTFTRNTSYGVIPDSTDLHVGNGDFTLEAWVKVAQDGTNQYIFGNWDPVKDWGFGLYIDGGGNVGLFYGNGAGTDYYGHSVETPATDSNWHHVAVTKTSGVYSYYCDGVLLTTGGDTMPTLTDPGVSWGVGTTGASNSNSLGGTLDEVAFYTHAVPARRVAVHYLTGVYLGPGLQVTPTLVQEKTGVTSTSGTLTVVLTSAPTDGNCLIITVADSDGDLTSITQTGATWTQAAKSGAHTPNEIWYAPNVSGASATVVIVGPWVTGSNLLAHVMEWSGLLAAPLDRAAGASWGSAAQFPTPTVTPTQYGDLAIATFAVNDSRTIASGPLFGFGSVSGSPLTSGVNLMASASEVQGVPSPTETYWTINTADYGDAVIALFKAQLTPSAPAGGAPYIGGGYWP